MIEKFLTLILFIIIASSECSKILFIHSCVGRSSVLPVQVLAKDLAKKGHNVTFVSLYPLDQKIENYRDIKIEPSDEVMEVMDETGKAMTGKVDPFKALSVIDKIIYQLGNETLQMPALKDLMKNEQFDLVISGYFLNDFLLGLADHFKCPSIVFFSANHASMISKMVGNPLSPEGAPHMFSNSKVIGTFLQRVKNFLLNIIDRFIIPSLIYYRSKAIYE